ncbi:NADP-dependent oxidoreductase [Streptomyces sp. NPDC127033]|uniref:NADP-dependent oxidoreductase n=1 Tax=Streptomyces sp. NPDC127033 TaxID=3347110 RepID=UPI00364BFEB4
MRAFTIERYGDSDGGRIAETPDPLVGAEDVLIRVSAASVNPLDLRIRGGDFKTILPYRLPLVLGNDLAGVVVRVGPSVTGFAVGDEVYARPDKDRIGAFAELIAVHQDDVAAKPATLTMEEAASLPLVALTAWQALVERARVHPGQKVLIHAGSGGVGTIAIQLAKHLGAHVVTTASTAKIDLVRKLGADIVVDYKKQDFETVLDDYDVVLDPLGGETLKKSLRVLKPGGKVISIVGPPDPAFARELGANAATNRPSGGPFHRGLHLGAPVRLAAEGVRAAPGDTPKPIMFNEDDHFDFDQPHNHMKAALAAGASWGYFDPGSVTTDPPRPTIGDYHHGYQAVPVDWAAGTETKRGFFDALRRVR